MSLLGHGPAFCLLSKPQQILSQLDLRRIEIRIRLQRLSLKPCAFSKAIFLGQLTANQVIHFWIDRGKLHCVLVAVYCGFGLVPHMENDRLQSMRFGEMWIHGQNFLKGRFGTAVIFCVDLFLCDAEQSRRMMWVEFQRFLKQQAGLLTVGRLHGFRKQKLHIWVIGECGCGRRQQLRRKSQIAFIQRQSSGGEESIRAIRIILASPFEEAFLNGLCVRS